MREKICPNCGLRVARSWNFCPRCGFNLKNQQPNKAFIEVDINKVMKEIIPNLTSVLGSMLQQAPLRNQPSEDQSGLLKRWEERTEEVVEPVDVVTENNGITVHTIYMPGVENRSDVLVQKFENSIEIRAIGNDKRYLKIIGRSSDTLIISEDFRRESLTIAFQKRKSRN